MSPMLSLLPNYLMYSCFIFDQIKHATQQMARLREIDSTQLSQRSVFSLIDPLWNSTWNLVMFKGLST